ncbi:MAG: amidohydrolase [Ginsengibacter sp.]
MANLLVTIIQPHLIWEDKAANLKMFEDKIDGIGKSEIVILPEMFSTGFSMQPEKFAEKMDGETVNWMRQISGRKKIILTGSIMIEDGGKFYNRLIWMLPNGEMGFYDKRHLFGFGKEDEHYTPGGKRLIASVKGWKINLQVCYDLRFPVWARQKIAGDEAEFDLLVYVANWPEKRNTAWKTLLRARAIENQCYVVGVNRVGKDGNDIYHSGDSMIIDPLGEILFHKEHDDIVHTQELERGKLDEIRAKFPFLKDGDQFLIVD